MEIGYDTLKAGPNLMYSSLSRRFGAWLIDGLILGTMSVIIFHILPFVGWIVVWFFYAPIFESSEIRATPGKHLMGIQVADLMGRRISFRAALIRNVMKIVSTAILFFGYVFALFSDRKQTLHDLLADTVVVYGRSEVALADAWTESTKELFRAGQNAVSPASQTEGGASPSRDTSSEAKSAGAASVGNIADQLERIQSLRDRGALTQDEFEAAKRKILG
jgi:uncharacterized RDD family membrane protein YckC